MMCFVCIVIELEHAEDEVNSMPNIGCVGDVSDVLVFC